MGVRRGASANCRVGWLFAVVAAIALPCSAAAVDASGEARILYFEPLRSLAPSRNAGAQKSGHGELQHLRFDAYGRRFELSLDTNDRLTSQLNAKPGASSLRLYRGRIDSAPGSWVRLAARGAELHGMIWDGAELYVIEPADRVRDALVPPLEADSSGTIIFRLADVLIDASAASCATDHSSGMRKGTEAFDSLLRELKGSPALMQAAGASMRLEISALGDSLFLQRHTSEQDARDEILLRLNNVDGIFSSQLGVEIQVPNVNVNDALSDSLSDTRTPKTLLEELGDLRRRSRELYSRGLTHLFTGRDLEGTTVGIAYLDRLCHQRFGAGLTQATSGNSWFQSLVAAHEIGHSFGAVHDGDPEKACAATPEGLHLMSPSVNGSETFSQCSLQLMRRNIQSASCINSLPPADIVIPADLGIVRRPVTQPFDWELAVSNAGGSSANDVRIEILVPPVVFVDDAYVVGGSCTSGAGVTLCQLGDVAGGASRLVHFTLRSDVVGSNSISAHVTARSQTQTSNDRGDGSIVIEPEADRGITLPGPTSAVQSAGGGGGSVGLLLLLGLAGLHHARRREQLTLAAINR